MDTAASSALEHIAHCVDMWAVEPATTGDDATKELRGFEDAFDKSGGLWMLNQTMWDAGHGVWG